MTGRSHRAAKDHIGSIICVIAMMLSACDRRLCVISRQQHRADRGMAAPVYRRRRRDAHRDARSLNSFHHIAFLNLLDPMQDLIP